MKGRVSYVRLQLGPDGNISTATTPDPATFVSPDYGSTRLCRNIPDDKNSEPENCRSYAIYIPSSYDGVSPLPLHLSLHGNGGFAEAQVGDVPKGDGTGEFAENNAGLEGRYNQLADRQNFVVVYPNGRPNGATGTVQGVSTPPVNGRNWNDCRKLNPILRNGNANTTYSNADDVGFINALLDDVMGSLTIDPQRVYAHGYSNGAMMVLRLYQELGQRFTAFATTEGNQLVQDSLNTECAPPTVKKPIMLTFGDLDYVVPYYGGCVLDGAQVPLASAPSLYCQRGNMMSADQTIAYFTSYLETEPPGPLDQLWPLTWTLVNERVYTDGVPFAPDQARGTVNKENELPDGGGVAIYGVSTGKPQLYGAGNSTGYTRAYHSLEQTDAAPPVFVKKILNGGHTLSGLNPITDAAAALLLGPKNLDVQVADELYAFFNQFQPLCGPRNLSLGPVVDKTTARPAVLAWQKDVDGHNAFLQDDGICFPSRQSAAHLRGYLFAPKDLSTIPDGSLPVVVIGPGSANGQALYYLWSARELAAHGYLVLVEDPQGLGRSEIVGDATTCGAAGCPGVPFQSASNFVDGFLSALDYAQSKNHPWLVKADLTRIGIAGHSLSARSATYVGGIDERVKAVVAWDNMASDLHGDEGTPSGQGACADLIGGELPGTTAPITPRVPTMGQASDANGTCNFQKNIDNQLGNDPELKKTGYEHWRTAHVPAMQLVFTGSAHADWAQSGQSDPQQLESFEYYTRGWFDLYLRHDPAARTRLLNPQAQLSTPVPMADIFSIKFRSAAFMPEVRVDCADLVAAPCVASALPLPPVISRILDQVIDAGSTLGPLAFTLSDADTPPGALTVSAGSSNQALVPESAITLGGAGANRTVTVTPAANRFGTTTLTLTVSDGSSSASASFTLKVNQVVIEAPLALDAPAGGAFSWFSLLPLTLLAGLRRYRVQSRA